FLQSSNWKKVKSVYRHKVNEIYEIKFLGGKIEVTGDHSIFIRDKNRIISQRADKLKEGDILVNLPYKVRSIFIPGLGTTHKIKSHDFPKEVIAKELPVWNEYFQLEKFQEAYEFALANRGKIFQYEIARQVGVSQATIGLWQRGINQPRYFEIASCYETKGFPQKVQITLSLMKLLGYYTAEGRKTDYYLQFVFGAHEKELHQDCINLMAETLKVKPHLKYTKDNALRITYHSKFLGEFFEKHCGTGSHYKHVPEFLWDLSKEYFLEYFKGWAKGDGYTDKDGRLCGSSVSKQLILELSWLCAMHGIQTSINKKISKGGRIIKNKPLPESIYWILKIGKTSHPFKEIENSPYQIKKPIIKKIIKKPYQGYVYDLCGCENEAFFGGEKPILLHNSRVRDLFSTAKKAAPAIIFIDELDAIGRHRGAGLGGGHDEREQTLNQILVEMDGFERDTKLIVTAATNRPDVLDPALLRPGRFDRRVVLDLPDINDREEILKIHCRGKPLALNVNLREIAERTPGFSGADLANLVNEAAILAARKNKHQVYQDELLESIEKVLLGPERKSHILSKKEKGIAAFHEAGHALVSASLPDTEPVRKISIVARGMAAGYILKMPAEERKIKTKSEFLAEMATLLGGYCAEKLKFNEITTGASNDLERASELARKLVKEYGMSSLGPVSFGEKDELVFLGKEFGEQRNYSEEVAAQIDKEVAKFIKDAEQKSKKILTKNKKLLEKIAQTLIEKETIEREEFEELIKRKAKISEPKKEPLTKKEKSLKVKIRQV
ncbi:MAG: AAA family ATPase, partial [bacterium]|nr:AAA family ATPase [bacterium]